MIPHEDKTISELLRMSLNEDVFEQILGILEQKQRQKVQAQLGQSRVTEAPVSIKKTAMIGLRNVACSFLTAAAFVTLIHAQAQL